MRASPGCFASGGAGGAVRRVNQGTSAKGRLRGCVLRHEARGTHCLGLGVIPAKAGIQVFARQEWIPVFTGMTSRRDDSAGRECRPGVYPSVAFPAGAGAWLGNCNSRCKNPRMRRYSVMLPSPRSTISQPGRSMTTITGTPEKPFILK